MILGPLLCTVGVNAIFERVVRSLCLKELLIHVDLFKRTHHSEIETTINSDASNIAKRWLIDQSLDKGFYLRIGLNLQINICIDGQWLLSEFVVRNLSFLCCHNCFYCSSISVDKANNYQYSNPIRAAYVTIFSRLFFPLSLFRLLIFVSPCQLSLCLYGWY